MSSYKIIPVSDENYISPSNGYKRLELTSEQKIHIGAFANQLPAMITAGGLENASLYRLEFPDGVSGSLMELKQGGYTASLVSDDGKITGSAALHKVDTASMATMLHLFTFMSVITSQYFLAEINSKLSKISKSIDKILEFLYGDKKAELLSEISFTKYAYQNYFSIVLHDCQRTATIGSIQQAKKVAMKDIEFYLNELDSLIVTKDGTKLVGVVENSFRLKNCLELSIQLYVMSTVLEVYYSQNFDEKYISNIENETSVYITKCDKQILGAFAVLRDNVKNHKLMPLEKFNKAEYLERIERIVDSFSRGEESELEKSIHTALWSFRQKADFCIDKNGETYIKTT